mmetsp:Transcript_1987/g.2073  ORF Transcript_1987/g.2073 Transcript_1987/m.2073 type:complete len:214 (+) Transcript_1987:144-785(+)
MIARYAFFSLFLNFLAASAFMQEPSTKVTFDSSTDDKKLTLAGVGVRVKKIGPLSVKVYAAGVYLDRAASLLKLKNIPFKNEKDLTDSKEFSNMLIKDSGSKSIVLKMVRSVSGQKMADALAESVKPRMNGKELPSLESFKNILLTSCADGLTPSSVLCFNSTGKDLSVCVNGNKKGTVASPVLCEAFLDTYMGISPVSPSLKSSIVKTIMSW